jgi:hypothetical protein
MMNYKVWDKVIVIKKHKCEVGTGNIGKPGKITKIIGDKGAPGKVYYEITFFDGEKSDYLKGMFVSL